MVHRSQQANPVRPPRRVRLGVEALEDRCLLSIFPVTNLDDAGDGSLRAAINAANAAPGPDEVRFAADLTGSLNLTSGEITIFDPVSVIGSGAKFVTIDAEFDSRIFRAVLPPLGESGSGNVTISGLTLTRGQEQAGDGGVIYQSGGSLTLLEVHVRNGRADRGGGVYMHEGRLTIDRSTISGCTAATVGGGVASDGSTVGLWNSTISGNQAGTDGGGLSHEGVLAGGMIEYASVTITNNTAIGFGGGMAFNNAFPRMGNSIVAGNTAQAGPGDVHGGTFPLLANDSLIGNAGQTVLDYPPGNKTAAVLGKDPKLGPLQDNGGPTPTHALFAGSYAIDQGSDFPPFSTDQRGLGFSRWIGLQVDMGAFESPFNPPPPPEVVPVPRKEPPLRVKSFTVFLRKVLVAKGRAFVIYVREDEGAKVKWRVFPFGDTYTGGIRIESRQPFLDFNSDGVADVVVQRVLGPKSKWLTRIFSGRDGTRIRTTPIRP